MQIKSIALSKLLKLEIPQLAKLVLEILEKHDLETLKLEHAFTKFNEFRPDIESLIVGYRPHALNRDINPMREERIFLASSISYHMRGMAKGYIRGDKTAMWHLKDAADLYLSDLTKANEEIFNEKIDQFLETVNLNADLGTAIETLELTPQVNELRTIHIKLKSFLGKRNASLSERPKGVLAIASKAIRGGMRDLFSRINVAQMDNDDLNFKPLIDELNVQMTRYASLIKLRKSLRLKHMEAPSRGQTGVPVGMMSHMHVADATTNGFDDDLGQSLNQKKTIAPASKLLQPSSVEKKAQ